LRRLYCQGGFLGDGFYDNKKCKNENRRRKCEFVKHDPGNPSLGILLDG